MNIQYYYQDGDKAKKKQKIPRIKPVISSFTPTNTFADINVKHDEKEMKELNTTNF